jgi:hypothetical protein
VPPFFSFYCQAQRDWRLAVSQDSLPQDVQRNMLGEIALSCGGNSGMETLSLFLQSNFRPGLPCR